MSTSTAALLAKLHLQADNAGVCHGPGAWLTTTAAPIVSYNPTTGAAIARVIPADRAAYDATVAAAQAGFARWRTVPAPKRGEVVRDLGNLLRAYKEPLGELVTLEMGKIRAEGLGEVQEMIDICDFAVGLSRQLYGLTMHSERPGHRMYEQWHPLGPSASSPPSTFPWQSGPGTRPSPRSAATRCSGSPASWFPLTAVAVQHLANQVMADHGLTGVFTLAVGAGDVGRWMTEDARLPLISFTGSILRAAAWRRPLPGAWDARCSNWAATTPSSSLTRPTWISRCAPSCLARWAPPASAAPRRGG
jgi:aldehyde dehydrogenase (NAD+)